MTDTEGDFFIILYFISLRSLSIFPMKHILDLLHDICLAFTGGSMRCLLLSATNWPDNRDDLISVGTVALTNRKHCDNKLLQVFPLTVTPVTVTQKGDDCLQ